MPKKREINELEEDEEECEYLQEEKSHSEWCLHFCFVFFVVVAVVVVTIYSWISTLI